MAGHLEQNHGCDWVVCDSDRFLFFPERNYNLKDAEFSYPIAESLLLERAPSYVWLHMFRKSYCVSCGMQDAVPAERGITQEPLILLPLALGGSRPHYIRRPLYRYLPRENSKVSSVRSISDGISYLNERKSFTESVLSRLTRVTPLIGELLQMGYMTREHHKLCPYAEYDELGQAGKLAHLLNESGRMRIDGGIVAESGFEPLARHFSNKVIGYTPNQINIKRKPGGRVIAYAAYGKASRQIRHGLLRSDIRPDVFWDIAAKPGDNVEGIPITLPDFEGLHPQDICLVLLKDALIFRNVLNELASRLPSESVWLYYEVVDHLAAYYYGDAPN
jgi:hypothetical protein